MKTLKFYWYPKCDTCRRAKKWLDEHGKTYEAIHIVDESPTREEIQMLHQRSGLPLQKFFNTTGVKYRELGLKDVVKTASEDEMLTLLSSDGMLLKRPIVFDGKKVTIGYNPELFAESWK